LEVSKNKQNPYFIISINSSILVLNTNNFTLVDRFKAHNS